MTSIYSETDFKPRIYWKSEYNAYSKEKQLEKDIETSRINNFRIEDIQYELTYLKSEHKVDPNTKLKSIWYIFSIKNCMF